MDERVSKRIEKAIAEKVFPGCVIGTLRKGEHEVQAFGNVTYESGSPRVEEDTVYDVASVTKSIPMASLASSFINEGKLALDERVRTSLPELNNDHGTTIEDLLRYRVHGVQLSKLRYKTFEEIRTHALEHGFDGPPGESVYTNMPAFILGLILEKVGNASLGALAHRNFFEPLEMNETTFFPSPELCAPTEIDERGEVRGLPHDESAYVFAKTRRAVGHAGLFSTAPDLLHFLEALLAGNYPFIVEGAEEGLGWQVNDANFMGRYTRPKTFGKTGFTGTSVLCDIPRATALVIISNRTYPKRPQTTDAINAFRRDIADIILGHA